MAPGSSETEQLVDRRLEEYRRLLGNIVPPSQLDEQMKVFLDLRTTVPAENLLMSLDAAIQQLEAYAPKRSERGIRELQIAYVAATPTLSWWSERARRGIDPETDPEFLARCAKDQIHAAEDREFAVTAVLSGRLQSDRSPLYGQSPTLDDASAWEQLPAAAGPGAPVPIAVLPDDLGIIEVTFPDGSHPFQEEPRDLVVRLASGDSWSLSTQEGVQRLFRELPLEIRPSTLGSLLHWMLAPLPWGTTIAGIAETPAQLDDGSPEWFREWVDMEESHRNGERSVDDDTAAIFGMSAPEKPLDQFQSLALKLSLPDGGSALAVYAQAGSAGPQYEIHPVRAETYRLHELVVENLHEHRIKQIPPLTERWTTERPTAPFRPDLTFHLDLPYWMDFLHIEGTTLISERALSVLEEAVVDGYEAILVTVQHAGHTQDSERRPYFILNPLYRYDSDAALRIAGSSATLPGVFCGGSVQPELKATVYHTGMVFQEWVRDTLKEARLRGMDSDFTGLEIRVHRALD